MCGHVCVCMFVQDCPVTTSTITRSSRRHCRNRGRDTGYGADKEGGTYTERRDGGHPRGGERDEEERKWCVCVEDREEDGPRLARFVGWG
jgi:hypothetical protein